MALALLNVALGVHGALVTFPLNIHGTDEDETRTLPYIRGSWRLHLLQVSVVAVAAAVASAALGGAPLWRRVVVTFAILQLPYQFNDYLRRLFLARHDLDGLVYYDATTSLARLFILVVMLAVGIQDIWGLSVGLGVVLAASLILHGRKLERRLRPPKGATSVVRVREVISRNWPLTRLMLPEVVSYHLSAQVFLALSASLLRPVEVAVLGGIQAVANMINVFLVGLTNYGLADLSRSRHRGDYQAWGASARSMCIMAFVFSFSCAVVFVVAPVPLLTLVYGSSSYMLAYDQVLRLFAFVVLARTGSVLLMTVLRSVEYQSPVTHASLVSGVIALVIAAPFLRAWGLTGAVLGLLAGQIVLLGMLGIGFARSRGRIRAQVLGPSQPVVGATREGG